MKYDNCIDCQSKCEHAGKDREFVCPGGVSCKVLYSKEGLERFADQFAMAIVELARKPENLDNLRSYLSVHFPLWIKKYANSPEGLVAEMQKFASIEIDPNYKLRIYWTEGTHKGDIKAEEFFHTEEEMADRYLQLYRQEHYSFNPTAWFFDGSAWNRIDGF